MPNPNFASEKVPKHLAVAQQLRERIHSGEWKAGERLPSYSECCELFGAHTVTLEKAHAELEREGLIVRQRRRGIFVADGWQGTERPPATRRTATGLLGVAGMGFSFRDYSPYWVKLLRGIREASDEAEMQVILLDHQSNKGWEKADGVLICDWSNETTMQFLPPAMPCISVLVPTAGVASVYADDFQGGRQATEALLDLGHTHIAFMHTRDTVTAGRRVAGWRDALLARGIEPLPEWEMLMRGNLDFGASFVEHGRLYMSAWLREGWRKAGCTAILCHNDETALGVVNAFQQAGIRVPEDVSVVGFDGAQPPEFCEPHLSTLAVPLELIGAEAVSLLVRQLKEEDTGLQHRVFPVTWRQGFSTGAAPGAA